MVPREEFVRRLDAARREENRLAILWLVVFFTVIFAQIPLFFWCESTGSPWLALAIIIEITGFLAGNIWLFIWYFNNRARRFGLLCPNCGVALHGVVGQLVLANSRCPACGVGICEA